ncbi:hypothetical protein B0H10DRAFT_1796135, partial [Mycena sp. CBHHK59/15]
YRKWAKKHNFESRLEEDVQARKKAATEAEEAKQKLQQQSLDPHLKEKPERVVPYSDQLFLDAAVEWLIGTDQPLDALDHPKFREMIDVAARAQDGVRIPGRKTTRVEILNLFQQQMEALWVRIHAACWNFQVTCFYK